MIAFSLCVVLGEHVEGICLDQSKRKASYRNACVEMADSNTMSPIKITWSHYSSIRNDWGSHQSSMSEQDDCRTYSMIFLYPKIL